MSPPTSESTNDDTEPDHDPDEDRAVTQEKLETLKVALQSLLTLLRIIAELLSL